ncbi:hypothetical protein [Streptomyces sp. CB01580]|nr:hypothetical protein [Streptomyces sp. CB01580]
MDGPTAPLAVTRPGPGRTGAAEGTTTGRHTWTTAAHLSIDGERGIGT